MNEKLGCSLAPLIVSIMPGTSRRISAELEVNRDLRRNVASEEGLDFAYADHRIKVRHQRYFLDGKMVDRNKHSKDWKLVQRGFKDVRRRLIKTHMNFLK